MDSSPVIFEPSTRDDTRRVLSRTVASAAIGLALLAVALAGAWLYALRVHPGQYWRNYRPILTFALVRTEDVLVAFLFAVLVWFCALWRLWGSGQRAPALRLILISGSIGCMAA